MGRPRVVASAAAASRGELPGLKTGKPDVSSRSGSSASPPKRIGHAAAVAAETFEPQKWCGSVRSCGLA